MVVSAASLQGPRPYQEDRFVVSGGDGGLTKAGVVIVPSAANCSSGSVPTRVLLGGEHDPAVVAVFDGHGGAAVSSMANGALVSLFRAALGAERAAGAVATALASALGSIEAQMTGNAGAAKCGSTAAVVALGPRYAVAANLGDSRAVLARRSAPRQPLALTLDDKPDRADEMQRVRAAGGVVTPESARDCARVGHASVPFRLAMSRALGDFSLKLASWVPRPLLLATPTLTSVALRPGDDELLIVASDGVWDVLSNEQACGVARDAIRARRAAARGEGGEGALQKVRSPAELLVLVALQRGSGDNCTAVVVEFDEAGEGGVAREAAEGAGTITVLGGLDPAVWAEEARKMGSPGSAKL